MIFIIYINLLCLLLVKRFNELFMGIGDWGLGIGPNPQSPIPNSYLELGKYKNLKNKFVIFRILIKVKLLK